MVSVIWYWLSASKYCLSIVPPVVSTVIPCW